MKMTSAFEYARLKVVVEAQRSHKKLAYSQYFIEISPRTIALLALLTQNPRLIRAMSSSRHLLGCVVQKDWCYLIDQICSPL